MLMTARVGARALLPTSYSIQINSIRSFSLPVTFYNNKRERHGFSKWNIKEQTSNISTSSLFYGHKKTKIKANGKCKSRMEFFGSKSATPLNRVEIPPTNVHNSLKKDVNKNKKHLEDQKNCDLSQKSDDKMSASPLCFQYKTKGKTKKASQIYSCKSESTISDKQKLSDKTFKKESCLCQSKKCDPTEGNETFKMDGKVNKKEKSTNTFKRSSSKTSTSSLEKEKKYSKETTICDSKSKKSDKQKLTHDKKLESKTTKKVSKKKCKKKNPMKKLCNKQNSNNEKSVKSHGSLRTVVCESTPTKVDEKHLTSKKSKSTTSLGQEEESNLTVGNSLKKDKYLGEKITVENCSKTTSVLSEENAKSEKVPRTIICDSTSDEQKKITDKKKMDEKSSILSKESVKSDHFEGKEASKTGKEDDSLKELKGVYSNILSKKRDSEVAVSECCEDVKTEEKSVLNKLAINVYCYIKSAYDKMFGERNVSNVKVSEQSDVHAGQSKMDDKKPRVRHWVVERASSSSNQWEENKQSTYKQSDKISFKKSYKRSKICEKRNPISHCIEKKIDKEISKPENPQNLKTSHTEDNEQALKKN